MKDWHKKIHLNRQQEEVEQEEPKGDNCYLKTIIIAVICFKELMNLIYYFFVVSIIFIVVMTATKTYRQEFAIFLL